jgi:hypothetical protein
MTHWRGCCSRVRAAFLWSCVRRQESSIVPAPDWPRAPAPPRPLHVPHRPQTMRRGGRTLLCRPR